MANLEKKMQRQQIIAPVVEKAMQGFLGLKVDEISKEISDKLVDGKFDFEINVCVPFKQSKEIFKKSFILRLLHQTGGNISEASKIANIDRRSMHRLIKKHKIDPDFFRNQKKYSEKEEKEDYVKQVIGETLGKYELTRDMSQKVDEETTKNISDKIPEIRITFKEALDMFEKEYFKQALEFFKTKGKTAKGLKIRYETLIKKIKKLNL